MYSPDSRAADPLAGRLRDGGMTVTAASNPAVPSSSRMDALVVLQTRERVHDLGVFKAVGMTPRQTIAMVVCSVAGIGLAAGLIAIPAGIALHHYVVPVMGHAAQTALPASVLTVYQPWELVLLAVSGLAIAVAGTLLPASWAARARTASALRAE
jgi:putative ABC transport system permease protein